MTICAYRADKRAFLVLQSWGENAPPGPKTLGQPDCSFWITWDACQRIVRSGDKSLALELERRGYGVVEDAA